MSIGVMQGRLSPQDNGRIQFFPKSSWEQEFKLAMECGFDSIEWVLDEDLDNPIFNSEGRRKIQSLKQEFNMRVPSICCDYFMEYPFHCPEHPERLKSLGVFAELLRVCSLVGITYVELPIMGDYSLKNESYANCLLGICDFIYPLLESLNLTVLLELDLPPPEINRFFEKVPNNRILLNYDFGNSAYWGFDAEEEINLYGDKIANVHIKDCTPEKYSVPLGQGNVDFDLSMKLLAEKGYRGDFILQTARVPDDIAGAKEFLQFSSQYINKCFHDSKAQ